MNGVKVTVDKVPDLLAALEELQSQRVLIGIPGDKAARKEGDGPNNAMLGYVHEYGEPAANIPARPFLRPAAERTKDQVTAIFSQAARDVLSGKDDAARKALTAAGDLGVSAARAAMTEGAGYKPLTPAALRSRLYRRLAGAGLRRKDNPKAWDKRRAKLLKPKNVRHTDGTVSVEYSRYTLAGARPLLDTTQLRNALTFVIRKK